MKDLVQEIMLNRSQFLGATGFFQERVDTGDDYSESSNAWDVKDTIIIDRG